MTRTAQRGVAITATAMSLVLVACGSVTDSHDAAAAHDSAPGVVDATAGHAADASPPIDAPGADAAIDAATCGSSSVCVEAVQAPWNGPAVFYEDVSTATPPACPSGYPMQALELNGGLNGGNTRCDCSCGLAAGTTCGDANLIATNDSTCTTVGMTQLLQPGACFSLTATGSFYSVAFPLIKGGQCSPTPTKIIPAATWDKQFRVCVGNGSFTSTGCSANQLCVPKPSAPFDSQICIYTTGDVTCPAGSAYSNRIVRYKSFSDTRDCTTCACSAPSGSCGGHVDLAHDSDGSACNGTTPILDARLNPGDCKSAPSATSATYSDAPSATCTPSNSKLTGSLSPSGPTTFCCLTP